MLQLGDMTYERTEEIRQLKDNKTDCEVNLSAHKGKASDAIYS